MILQDLNYSTKLKDIKGKEMNAIEVFSLVILFLKDNLLKRLRRKNTVDTLDESMIHWVLTVPAIWNDKAKQFMRKAAEKVL